MRSRERSQTPRHASAPSFPVLWAATQQQITGYDSRNGSVRHVLDISKLLNTTCRITSKVMVAMSEKNAPPIGERLVFGVACLANQSAPIGDVNIHHHHPHWY
nr:hypothetical protein BaRGS_023701 [Batillaria attramentaria]